MTAGGGIRYRDGVKLVVEMPAGWTATPDGATIAPGVSLRIGRFAQLPLNLEAWRDAWAYAGVDRRQVRVVAALDRTTDGGWPLGFVVTEVGGRRRLHAFYRFLVYGVVAVVEGEAHAFDAVMDEARKVLVSARPDFGTERPRAVREVWAGFDAPAGAGGGIEPPISVF